MRQSGFRVVLCVLGSSFITAAMADGNIRAAITNIKEEMGVVRVSLFPRNRAQDFPDGKAPEERELRARRDGVSVTFEGVASGDYAVAAFHDKNNNGRIDKTALGIPKEPYGNSGKYSMRKPSFERSQFAVGSEDVELNIELH